MGFSTHLSSILENESPALGSVAGRLERVTIHRKSAFTLYPPIHGESIECNFNESELDNVLAAVGKQVTVYGKLFYSPKKIFPVRVEADSFEVEPDNESLPTLLDIKEVMKDLSKDDGFLGFGTNV